MATSRCESALTQIINKLDNLLERSRGVTDGLSAADVTPVTNMVARMVRRGGTPLQDAETRPILPVSRHSLVEESADV